MFSLGLDIVWNFQKLLILFLLIYLVFVSELGVAHIGL